MRLKKAKGGALFLDRDGVMNRMVKCGTGWDSPHKVEAVVLVPETVEVIRWANDRSIPVIEISNQPGVAKGKLTQKESDAIQRKVEYLLGQKGARLDKVYVCPHHPNGVVPGLTRECDCRKPKPGLLLRAAKEVGIDLEKSVFLGDKESDALAGKAAGCKTIIYLHDEDELEKVARSRLAGAADYKIRSLQDVNAILNQCPKLV
ncbi:MAG: HAD-IIIA family hydrolase [Microgenomates group bacterium]